MPEQPVKIKLDTRQFQAALREIARTDKKELAFVLNDQGIRFCQEAIRRTRKVTPGKVKRELNRRQHVATRVFTRKGRRLKRRAKVRARHTLAERLVNTIRVARGEKPVFGAEQKAQAQRLIDYRTKSGAFIRAGWLPALGIFLRALGRPVKKKLSGAAIHGRPHGGGRPARGKSFRQFARMFNDAIIAMGKYSSVAGRPLDFAMAGVNKALANRTADMKAKVIERLNRNHKKYNARGRS